MGADQLESGQELDEEELRKRVLQYHQDHVSRMLTWVDVEEQRAVHLGDYKNVVRDLADSSLDDWVLLRAAMLHVACSENLNLEHNWWLGQEIYASFEKEFHHLQYVVSRTRADRPTPRFDPQEMFPNYRMTDADAIYYYSRAALALLVSREDPGQAIGLFEDLNSIFVPRIRCHLPQGRHSLHLDGELERLPLLYERVGRFEDALNLTPVSFAHSWSSPSPCEVAVRRLGGWVNQLSGSGSVSTVERCLDKIYEWMESATDVDEEERDRIGECPTTTRQFWAWYYGNALGRLIVARTSLRASLLDEIEAGDWENRWHVAAVLFENSPESWSEYRERALKFYNTSDIEHGQQIFSAWNAPRPPHLNPQSDLYWAIRVGFADAHSEHPSEERGALTGISDSLQRIETIASSMAQHVLRAERNTDNLLDDVRNRLPPNQQYWFGLLQDESDGLVNRLPQVTTNHLIDALKYKSAEEWDLCIVATTKSVESLFSRIIVPEIQSRTELGELTLALPRGKRSPRRIRHEDWVKNSLSNWARVLSTSRERGLNEPLCLALPRIFPDADLDAIANLSGDLDRIAQLRGSSAHDTGTTNDRKNSRAQELWELVVSGGSKGFLTRFCSAFGLNRDAQASRNDQTHD